MAERHNVKYLTGKFLEFHNLTSRKGTGDVIHSSEKHQSVEKVRTYVFFLKEREKNTTLYLRLRVIF